MSSTQAHGSIGEDVGSDDPPTRSLKILGVIPSLTRGGAERVLSLLTHDWAESHDVVIAAFDASHPAYDFRGKIVHLGLELSGHLLARARVACLSTLLLIKLFRSERPDRIVSFMEPANFPAILAGAVVGALDRLVVSVRHNPNLLPSLRRLLIPRLYHLPSAVVAVSDGVRGALLAMGLSADRVTTIPNPVALPDTTRTAAVTSSAGRLVLAAGRLIPAKGFDLLLNAFSRVEHPNLQLVVLGEGPEHGNLLALARRLHISDRLCFPGAVSDISRWYHRTNCFVLSSRNEGWPNVLVEAMAAGCAVVSFRCDYGPAEIVQDEISGLLVPPGNVNALADAIARVMTDRHLSASLSAGGIQRAAWFASHAVASRWLTL